MLTVSLIGILDTFIYLEFLKNKNTKFRRKIVGHGPFGPTLGSAHVLEDFFPNLKYMRHLLHVDFRFRKQK